MGLHAVPIIAVITTLVAVVVTYTVSVLGQHRKAFMPTISETADDPPESCIFSLFLAFTDACFLFCIVVRHREMKSTFVNPENEHTTHYLWLNNVVLVVGSIVCGCMLGVATVQSSNIPAVHYVCAIGLFLLVNVYMGLSLRLFRGAVLYFGRHIPQQVMRLRMFVFLLCSVSFLGCVVFGSIWAATGNLFWWSILACFEYTMALSLAGFFLSYVYEFRHLEASFDVVVRDPSFVKMGYAPIA